MEAHLLSVVPLGCLAKAAPNVPLACFSRVVSYSGTIQNCLDGVNVYERVKGKLRGTAAPEEGPSACPEPIQGEFIQTVGVSAQSEILQTIKFNGHVFQGSVDIATYINQRAREVKYTSDTLNCKLTYMLYPAGAAGSSGSTGAEDSPPSTRKRVSPSPSPDPTAAAPTKKAASSTGSSPGDMEAPNEGEYCGMTIRTITVLLWHIIKCNDNNRMFRTVTLLLIPEYIYSLYLPVPDQAVSNCIAGCPHLDSTSLTSVNSYNAAITTNLVTTFPKNAASFKMRGATFQNDRLF